MAATSKNQKHGKNQRGHLYNLVRTPRLGVCVQEQKVLLESKPRGMLSDSVQESSLNSH